jgi:hypothetical protein
MYPTLEELSRMSAQNVFDHVAGHLLRQAGRHSTRKGRAVFTGMREQVRSLAPQTKKALRWKDFV